MNHWCNKNRQLMFVISVAILSETWTIVVGSSHIFLLVFQPRTELTRRITLTEINIYTSYLLKTNVFRDKNQKQNIPLCTRTKERGASERSVARAYSVPSKPYMIVKFFDDWIPADGQRCTLTKNSFAGSSERLKSVVRFVWVEIPFKASDVQRSPTIATSLE